VIGLAVSNCQPIYEESLVLLVQSIVQRVNIDGLLAGNDNLNRVLTASPNDAMIKGDRLC
jgi:hypothetical protein